MASITIIEEYDTYAVVSCARCGGSGSVKATPVGSRDCPTCDGNGKLRLESTPPFSTCGRCGGSGQTGGKSAVDKTCDACEGTGALADDNLESY